MERSLEELETIIRAAVCRVCTDRASNGSCGLEDPGSCALFRLFPQVVRTIRTMLSDAFRDYYSQIINTWGTKQCCGVSGGNPVLVTALDASESSNRKAIRQQVCPNCEQQASDGSCERRNGGCAVDAYLLLIVDAIEEATGRKFQRPADFVTARATIPLTIFK